MATCKYTDDEITCYKDFKCERENCFIWQAWKNGHQAGAHDTITELKKITAAAIENTFLNGDEHAQKHCGEWRECKDDNFCKCSECEQIIMSEERSKFCPNCGADMRVKNELNRVSKELNSE